MSEIATRLQNLREDISAQAHLCGRRPADIKLIAVSKTQPLDRIIEAHALGLSDFGENYAQELFQKRAACTKLPVKWHFIGHLQRNKVSLVCHPDVLVHTLDSLRLAHAIDAHARQNHFVQDVLIEVKLSPDPKKSGCLPEDLEALVQKVDELSGLRLWGLMTIGSHTTDSSVTDSEFYQLKTLRDDLNQTRTHRPLLTELSMGMSSDYMRAIRHGATLLRIGTRIFGERT